MKYSVTKWDLKGFDSCYGYKQCPNLFLKIKETTGCPERSRQSNWAVFTVEGGLDSKFPYVN